MFVSLAAALALALLACTSSVARAAPARSPAPARDTRDPTWFVRDFGRGADRSVGMAQSPDGTTVFDAVASSGQFAAAAHDAGTGATRWAVRLDLMQGDLAEFAEAMALSPDGTRLFITGDAEQSVDTRSVVTVALDTATGSVLWETRIGSDPDGQAIPNGIAVALDGSSLYVIAARTGAGGQDFWDYMTTALDASTGANTWTSVFAGRAHAADIPRAVAVAPDGGRVFVTGTSIRPLTRRDFTTVAYDAATGHRDWVAPHGGLSDDYAGSLAVAPDGSSVYVTGTIRAFTPDAEIQVLALDPSTGKPLHRHRFASPSEDRAQGIAIAPDGSTIVVVGESAKDFVTLAFSPSLDPLWTATFDAKGLTDVASAAAVSPDGARVYVVGRSENGLYSCEGDVIGTVYTTVAYDTATGHEQWTASYGGSSKKDPDAATAVAVAPAGDMVFVSGTSDDGCRSAPDVATLAYPA